MINKVRASVEGEKRVSIRLPRGGGKTTSALEWALDNCKGKSIGFISMPRLKPKEAESMLLRIGRILDIEEINKDAIHLEDGTSIYFKSPRETRACIKFDALVMDEFGTMTFDDAILMLASVRFSEDFPICLAYSQMTSEMKGLLKRIESVSPLHRVTFDFLDMLEHGLMEAEDVREHIQDMGKKKFSEAFGPYSKDTGDIVKYGNAFFMPLLQRP